MKNFCLFFLFNLTFLIVNSQEITIKSSPETTNPYPQNFWTQNLGSDETGHYLIRDIGPITQPSIILEKYDINFNLLFSKDIESSSGILGDSKKHFKTILGNGEILVFLASWNKDKVEDGLWVKRLTLNGDPIGEEIQLKADKGESYLKSNTYKVALSENGKMVAVLTEPIFERKNMESFKLSIFNTTDFTKTSEKEFTFNFEMDRYPRNQVFINNKGAAFVFKEVKISNKEFKYYLSSLSFENHYQEALDLMENQVNQSQLMINKNGELIGLGLLASTNKYITSWQKNWFLKANNKSILQNKVEPLGASYLSQFMNEKAAAKEDATLDYYTLKDVIENPNGGYIMLTEKLDKSSTPITTSTGQSTAYDYKLTYGGINLFSFEDNGNLAWTTSYDKKQQFQTRDLNMEMGSFAYGIVNNQLLLIWNYTESIATTSFSKYHWTDKNGNKIAVEDVFGQEARYPTFLTSINLGDGSFNYTDRTFSSFPLAKIQEENNFRMAVDPSFFFTSPNGITVLSRMDGLMPKKFKFSTISFE